jgi:hypothetical protein
MHNLVLSRPSPEQGMGGSPERVRTLPDGACSAI